MKPAPLVLAGLVLTGLAAHAATAPAAAAEPKVHRLVMDKMRFAPMPQGIRAGDVILWINRDIVPHTATARDRSFDVDLPAGQSRRMKVTRAGSFAFYCRYHPGMKGVLTAGR